MKRALISDVHSNLEALDAVLEDIHQQGISEVYCLGDIVGYGPNPRECLDKVMELDVCILGNHDEALVKGAWGFNQVARAAMDWTRDQLRPTWLRPLSRGRKGYVLAQRIVNAGGEVAADTEVTSVGMDLDARQTVAMPDVLAEQFDRSTPK